MDGENNSKRYQEGNFEMRTFGSDVQVELITLQEKVEIVEAISRTAINAALNKLGPLKEGGGSDEERSELFQKASQSAAQGIIEIERITSYKLPEEETPAPANWWEEANEHFAEKMRELKALQQEYAMEALYYRPESDVQE